MNNAKFKEIRNIVEEETKSMPSICKDYIEWELVDFFTDDNFDESYQSNSDVAFVISSCLNKLGIKNEVVTNHSFTIRRVRD